MKTLRNAFFIMYIFSSHRSPAGGVLPLDTKHLVLTHPSTGKGQQLLSVGR